MSLLICRFLTAGRAMDVMIQCNIRKILELDESGEVNAEGDSYFITARHTRRKTILCIKQKLLCLYSRG